MYTGEDLQASGTMEIRLEKDGVMNLNEMAAMRALNYFASLCFLLFGL